MHYSTMIGLYFLAVVQENQDISSSFQTKKIKVLLQIVGGLNLDQTKREPHF